MTTLTRKITGKEMGEKRGGRAVLEYSRIRWEKHRGGWQVEREALNLSAREVSPLCVDNQT